MHDWDSGKRPYNCRSPSIHVEVIMRSIFQVMKQEYPKTSRPYRIIETLVTSDGMRSRICEGCWTTFDEAKADLEAKENTDASSNTNVLRPNETANLQEVRSSEEDDFGGLV